jgi:hypothetical protein
MAVSGPGAPGEDILVTESHRVMMAAGMCFSRPGGCLALLVWTLQELEDDMQASLCTVTCVSPPAELRRTIVPVHYARTDALTRLMTGLMDGPSLHAESSAEGHSCASKYRTPFPLTIHQTTSTLFDKPLTSVTEATDQSPHILNTTAAPCH